MVVVAGLLSCTTLTSQNKHEFSVYGGGGLSTLKYKMSVGEQKNNFGGLAGIGYTYFFSSKIGLGSGAELALYNAKSTIDNLGDKYMAKDMEGAGFEFRSTVSNYEEKQKAMYVNIPLMLQFQTGKKHMFYAAAGGKIGIPLNGKYKTSGATIKNSGYYAEEDYEYTTQEFMGFGTFTGRDMDDDVDFKLAYIVSAEAGMKWKLKDNLSLYTGAYFDYGLNDIQKDNDRRFVQYNTAKPKEFINNSVLTSQFSHNNKTENFTDKINLMSVGLKVKLAFGVGSRAAVVEEIPYTPPPTDNSAEEARLKAEKEARLKAEQEAARKAREEAEAKRKAELAAQEKARAEAELLAAKEEIAEPVTGYSLDQTKLSDAQKNDLNGKVTLLKKYPNLNIVCKGYTCNIGSTAINMVVGLRRAETAKSYLIENGIEENRVSAISMGESDPIVPNNNEENRRKNRRVEVIVE